MKKGERKVEKNYIKKRGKRPLNSSFLAINSLKNSIFKKKGGGMIEMYNIYPCPTMKK